MSEFIWVSKAEFEELKTMIYGMRSNVLDIKYSSCGINLDMAQVAYGGSASCPAKIKSKTGIYYLVDLYANGIDSKPSEEDAKLFILELNFGETLKQDTWVMANTNAIGLTGGGLDEDEVS